MAFAINFRDQIRMITVVVLVAAAAAEPESDEWYGALTRLITHPFTHFMCLLNRITSQLCLLCLGGYGYSTTQQLCL